MTMRSRRAGLSPHPSSNSVSPRLPNPFTATKLTFSLRLFYHYMREVAPTLPQAHHPQIREAWGIDYPQLAFEYDYLLNGLLALSAVHISQTRAPEDESLHTVAQIYFDRCINSFQNQVENLNRSNAEAIFFTGMTLAALAGPITRTWLKSDDEPYQLPMFSLQLTKALESLMSKSMRWLAETNLGPMLQKFGAPGQEGLPKMSYIREEEKTNLDALLDGLVPGSEEMRIYADSLEHVKVFYDGLLCGDNIPSLQRKFTRFAIYMSDPFMRLLELQDPRALVILAHQFAMKKGVNDSW